MSAKEFKKEEKKVVVVKNASDLQRLKLEKLMKNPAKPVVIPDPPKQKTLAAPPDFVRNVMGSSAGAGSGEFHVYRHLRRKEYARQKFIQEKSEKEKLDDEYHNKVEFNKRLAEEKTAKKRAKRLKKKNNAKLKGKKPKLQQPQSESENDSSSDNDETSEASGENKDSDSVELRQSNEPALQEVKQGAADINKEDSKECIESNETCKTVPLNSNENL